jgi:hypothetical protein
MYLRVSRLKDVLTDHEMGLVKLEILNPSMHYSHHLVDYPV